MRRWNKVPYSVASIEWGLGEQSPAFLKVGVDRLAILTDLLRLDRQIVA